MEVAVHTMTGDLERFMRELDRTPDDVNVWFNIAAAHTRAGNITDAITWYRRVLDVSPYDSEVRRNLLALLIGQGEFGTALCIARTGIERHPTDADLQVLAGVCAWKSGDLALSLSALRTAVCLRPEGRDAQFNLGLAEAAAGNTDAAIRCYQKALAVDPMFVPAMLNLGVQLDAAWQLTEAQDVLQRAAGMMPDDPAILNALANVFRRRGAFRDADDIYRRAIRIQPGSADVLNNIGLNAYDAGDYAGASSWFRKSIAADPSRALTHVNLSFALLADGAYADGWREFEWRYTEDARLRGHVAGSRRLRTGESVQGKTIVVLSEQGLGDVIQFARFLLPLQQAGARVVVECRPEIEPLLAVLPGVDATTPLGVPLPVADAVIPMMSLAGYFQATPESVRATPLRIPVERLGVEQWNDHIVARRGSVRTGFAWTGSRTNAFNAYRSVPQECIATLAGLPDIHFVQLQKGETLAGPQGWYDNPMEKVRDLRDAAALISCLDLVISPDTVVAHLAAALGVETWLLLPYSPDWRWARADGGPWYDCVRIFRQPAPWDWSSVLRSVTQALRERILHSFADGIAHE